MRRLLLLATFSTLVGCSFSDAPELAPAGGTVTMNGKPLADVGVTFFPLGEGPIAAGNTNEKGEFTMRTVNPGDGAPIGKHRVVLGAAEEGPRKGDAALIPEKYGRVDTSDLSADVKAGEKNVFKFELEP